MRCNAFKWITVLIVISCTFKLQARKVHVDSLRIVINKLPPTFAGDTSRVLFLIELAREINNDKIAVSYLRQALALAEKRKWPKGIMMVTCRTGFHYGRMGFDYRACEYLFKGLRLAEIQENDLWIGFAYRYLGDNHIDLGQFHKAIGFHKKSKAPLYKARDFSRYLFSINNIGISHHSLGDYDRAIISFNECLIQSEKLGVDDAVGICLTNLATSYEKKGNLLAALEYLEKFRKLEKSNPDDLAYANIETARILYLSGKSDEALTYAQAAYRSHGKIRSNTLKSNHQLLYQIYERQKNYKQAFHHLSQLRTLESRNLEDMQRKQIESLKFYYENEKQKTDIELLNSALRQKRLEKTFLLTGLWAGLTFIVLLFLAIYFITRKSRKIENQRNQINAIKEKLDQSNHQLLALNCSLEQRVEERTRDLTVANNELTVKNRQIKEAFVNGQSIERKRVASELHDNLGGTISALKWQFESIDTEGLSNQEKLIYDNVLSMMEVAYADVRNISHNLMPDELEREGLSAAISNLLSDLNRSGRIHFQFVSSYQEGFLGARELEVYGICLELINNILKHSRATEASLELTQSAAGVKIFISDNGIGIPDVRLEEKNGFGLKNLRRRIKSVNGQVAVSHLVPSGTLFEILIVESSEF